MTEHNQKELYSFFIKTNQLDRAKEISDVYPQFLKEEKPLEIAKPKEAKQKKGSGK